MRHLPCLLVLSGCAQVSVGGLVGGAAPVLVDAVYAPARSAFGDDGAIVVWITSFPEACDTLTTYNKAVNRIAPGVSPDAEQADKLATAWREAFPETSWRAEVVIRRTDPDDLLDRVALDGTDWEQQPEKGDEFRMELTEYRRYLDDDFFTGDAPEGDYRKTWTNDEGVLDVDRKEREGVLSGRLAVDTVDIDDGAAEGTLEVSFRARYCDGLVRQTLSLEPGP